ncbi:Nse4 C-terminal-domain-containing protein [Coniella lustricola]|uniref:Non-structural maintenance of chromosomes element 4 n=1 Tax=Coniella lustricola TaxID=2025994 RepID=A0A2T2ZX83_9PEZI|nr:Nse4 C-terminal-domain-containing protein [Coniella lustricola]
MAPEEDLEAYNPDQSLGERRQIQRGIRSLERDMHENAESYLDPRSTRVHDTLKSLDRFSTDIRQTSEATIDSKALLTLVDLNHRKLQRLTAGNLGSGIDPDEFVSKCITYMRRAAGIADDHDQELTFTQRRRRAGAGNGSGVDGGLGRPGGRNMASDDDDNDDDGSEDEDGTGGDMMNWAHLGRYACVPRGKRPALTGFLLGPLSVQKKARKAVTRQAPLRLRDLKEVRPEVLKTEDLAKNEKQDLTAICNQILKQLKTRQDQAIELVRSVHADEDMSDEDVERTMEKVGLMASGGIDLVRFCVNPRSFGQTIENMFYVSFLIKEGMVEVKYEENGLPSVCPSAASQEDRSATSKYGAMRRQAVMSLDMPTWRELIKTFNIQESMIEHRQEAHHQPEAHGWYS